MTHNTISFQRSNPLQNMLGVSRAMALPHEYTATRFPSFPALERTAVMGFNVPKSIAASFPITKCMLMRQATYPLWFMQNTSSAYTVNYSRGYDLASIGSNITNFTEAPASWSIGSQLGTVGSSGRPSVSGGGAVSGNLGYPLFGYDAGTGPLPWIYAPAGWRIIMTISGATAINGSPHELDYEVWSSPGECGKTLQGIVTGSAGSMQMYGAIDSCPDNYWIRPKSLSYNGSAAEYMGWYSVTITNATSTNYIYTTTPYAAQLGLGVAGTTPAFLPIAPPPEFGNSTLPYMSTRLTACAALFTNVTKVMNKEGSILAGRLNPAVTNAWTAADTDIVNLHPAEKQLLGMETGFYTYCPPSTDLAAFWDYTLDTSNGAGNCPVVRLDNGALVNYFSLADPDSGSSFAVNLDWHIEFRSTSTLWELGMSSMTLESFHQAQLALVAAGFFFNNEDHKSTVNKIVGALGKWSNRLEPMLSMVSPGAGAIVRAGSNLLLSQKPHKPPRTTSAEGAGWNPKKQKDKQPTPPKGKGKQQKGKGKQKK